MKYFFVGLLFLTSCGQGSTSENVVAKNLTDLTMKHHVPALGAGLMRSGAMKEVEVRGVRKFGSETLAQVDDAFHLGSCSKAMTATLAGIFIEEGKLSWTSTMKELFPELTLHSQYQNMTFETLLVHRGGFPIEESNLFNQVMMMNPTTGRALISKSLLNRTPEFTPDSTYRYSNFNYIIAGHILERLADKSWEDLIRDRIFKPLSMRSCGFGVTSLSADQSPTTIWAHASVNSIPYPRHFDNPLSYGPSSTIHCSLRDWSKFLNLHLKGFNGESNLIGSATFKKLHSTHPANDSSYTYGGWSLLSRSWANGPVLTHVGSNLLNYAVAWVAPKKEIIVMSATNIGGEDAHLATDEALQLLLSKYLP